VEWRLLRIRDNPLFFFSLTGDSSSIALREVVPVRRCQSPGEIPEVAAESTPSAGDEKGDLREYVFDLGMGIGAGTLRGANWGIPREPGLHTSGGSGNDESKCESTPYPARDCAESDDSLKDDKGGSGGLEGR